MIANPAESTRTRPVYRPAADIYETENALCLVLEIPGAGADHVQVSVDNRVLTVSAQSSVAVPPGYSATVTEFRPVDYERSFTLAEGIDTDHIEAELRDGLLTLTLPKARPAPAKTISVRAG